MRQRTWLWKLIGACAVAALLAEPAWAIGRRGGGGGGRVGGGGGGRPSFGGGGGPSFGGGSPSFGGGGAPSFGGGSRPSFGGSGGPSFGGGAPSFGGGAPSFGGGGGGISTFPTRPGGSIPSPGGGFNRPGVGGGAGIGGGTRPSLPPNVGGGTRPGTGSGAATRPSPGQVGDFLGIGRPSPELPSTLPGTVRPGVGRPGDVGRPGLGGDRPGLGDGGIGRPGVGDLRPGTREVNINNRPVTINTAIHNRPSWQTLNAGQLGAVNQRWNQAIAARPGDWLATRPDRLDHWNRWGGPLRQNWVNNFMRTNGIFNDAWWARNRPAFGWWHYRLWRVTNPWYFWWRRPVWGSVVLWFPLWNWSSGVFYDYGTDGNVVYQDNSVTINGVNVGTPAEFAQSAAELATVEAPADSAAVADAEWLPLGTFALSTDAGESTIGRVVQLAVNRDGIISGTLYNTVSGSTTAIEGRVDKDTQRVAMRVGTSDQVVVETGLYNLTQDNAPILVHFGTERTEQYVLVRLESGASDPQAGGAAPGAAPAGAPAQP